MSSQKQEATSVPIIHMADEILVYSGAAAVEVGKRVHKMTANCSQEQVPDHRTVQATPYTWGDMTKCCGLK